MNAHQKRRILVVSFSQTGQLTRVIESIMAPLGSDPNIEVVHEELRPVKPYPYPWPIIRFLDVFPECVYLDPPEMQPYQLDSSDEFDLIVLGYQPWYLSPSLPMTAFMKSEAAKVMNGKPVITVIACRNMWIMAQQEMKKLISANGGRLIDNIALVDQGSAGATFITTPYWLLTGKKNVGFGLPPAGVADSEVTRVRIFGDRIRQALQDDGALEGPLLTDLQPSVVEPNNILSEKMGRRSFKIWGGLLRAVGRQGSPLRVPLLAIYALFLGVAIITVVPLVTLGRKLLKLSSKHRAAEAKEVAQLQAPY